MLGCVGAVAGGADWPEMDEVMGISDRLQEEVGIKLITEMGRALFHKFMIADAAASKAGVLSMVSNMAY